MLSLIEQGGLMSSVKVKLLAALALLLCHFSHASVAVQCKVAFPANTPVPKTYNFCLNSGESDRLTFSKKPDIDSIRLIRTDFLACMELESDTGLFMFDKKSSSLVVGPTLPTGCYLVLWNEA